MSFKSLVTGGAGFIGSNIVDRLIEEGHDVVVIDNESSDSHESFYWNPKASNYKYDITDYESIEPLFEGVDYVFHLAAEVRIQETIDNPVRSINTNIIGTLNVLEASKINNVKKVVFSSTSACYGLNNSLPNIETQKEDCLNPYSITKNSGEKLMSMYYNLYGVKTISLRYFNVYGDRQPIRGQYAPVVGRFLEQKINNQPLTVVGDGSQKRDFINVKDIVDANILAATKKIKTYGEIFNIGSGKSVSIKELANFINSKKISYLKNRTGEAKETLANIDKAKKYLTWKPTVNLFDYLKGKYDT